MDDFLSQIKREHRQRREYLPEVTVEEVERLRREYPKDTPEGYIHISAVEEFGGAL